MTQNSPAPPVRPGPAPGPGIADRVARAAEIVFAAPLPIGLRVWDGSAAGPPGGPVLVLDSARAVRHLVRRPGELGLARAFVGGGLDVEGDLRLGLRLCLDFARRAHRAGLPAAAHWPLLLRLLAQLGAVGLPPGGPVREARPAGRAPAPDWDQDRDSDLGLDGPVISHPYDLGYEFYASVLGPSMAYSCGFWTSEDSGYGLAEAQRDNLELICRKLGLGPGARLLDVGCGWGALVLHAAEHYGVRATGVTMSAKQHEFVLARIIERGLGDLVEVRLQDYRAIAAEQFDAVASIEMGEHIADQHYPLYCEALVTHLRPGGRLYLQQLARGAAAPSGGAFIESYIAPDLTMRPVHRTLCYLEDAGLEIREVGSMREHYVRTVDAWGRGLHDNWDEIVRRDGLSQARIWRLYLAGGALAFEENRMSVHRILAVRTDPVDAGRAA
jgi:cyclopropane-fatty-acyl-phospholipid synthase